jgi:dUTP pyrophosphatase
MWECGVIDAIIHIRTFIHHTPTFITLITLILIVLFLRMQIRIVNRSLNPLPEYATSGSSGMDLRASLVEPMAFEPLQRALVPTGISIELPEGYEAQVRPRSGLAIKQGFTCLNSPGTIDADYRGEIKVILINLSQEKQVIHPGDRIAQLVIQTVEKASWLPVEVLNETERNAGGFGHTGKQ